MEHNLEQKKAKAARMAWIENVGFDKTKAIFLGLRPKGDSEQAAKKVLGTFFLKRLDIQDAIEILSSLQENTDEEFIRRVTFEAWLRAEDSLATGAVATDQNYEKGGRGPAEDENGEKSPLKERATTAPLSGVDPFAGSSLLSGMPFAESDALLLRRNAGQTGDIQHDELTDLERAKTEKQVVELLFMRVDPASEGPHVLPNQSVFEQGRKKKKQWLHCIAAEKEAILEAAEDRTNGLMGADMIERIEFLDDVEIFQQLLQHYGITTAAK